LAQCDDQSTQVSYLTNLYGDMKKENLALLRAEAVCAVKHDSMHTELQHVEGQHLEVRRELERHKLLLEQIRIKSEEDLT